MNKPNLFNQQLGIKLDKEEKKNIVSVKLADESLEHVKKVGISFPYEYFKKILRQQKIEPLEETLFKLWKAKLPIEIHKNCIYNSTDDSPEYKSNCYQSWLEFQALYLIASNNFVLLIENNSNILRKITKEKLALLFFQKAFVFHDGQAFFQVGEMSRLVLKNGLKDISTQLENLETKTSLDISSQNYSKIREESLFDECRYKDVADFQEKFWSINKERYKTKLQLEESSQLSFLDYFIKGIKELESQGENQDCIRNIKENNNLESPFRYFFKALLSQNFDSVEAEPEMRNGRIDLKVNDRRLYSSIIVEFKGWWNKDKHNVIEQTFGYLTNFDSEGYIFMINHLKKKDITSDYKSNATHEKSNYIEGSWEEIKYKSTGYVFYSSKHLINNKEKKLYHFIFNAKRT